MRNVFAFVFLFASAASALPISPTALAPADQKVYRALLDDFVDELTHFDGLREPRTEVDTFVSEFNEFISGKQTILTGSALATDKTWSAALKQPESLAPRSVPGELNTVQKKVNTAIPHSIADLKTYIAQRVGVNASALIQSGGLEAIVVGGRVASVLQLNDLKKNALHPLPSPYIAWGLRKFFVEGKGQSKPKLVIEVPPGRQYLEHYSGMLSALGVSSPRVYLDLRGREIYQRYYRAAINHFAKNAGGEINAVILGYANQWKDIKRISGDSDLNVELSPEIKAGLGLTGQILTAKTSRSQYRALIIRSDLAIWGDLSAMIAQSALDAVQPHAFIFMGSAGALDPRTSVYDLSSPHAFFRQDKTIRIGNFLNLSTRPGQSTDDAPSWKIWDDLTHGHTYSPVEQTADYINQNLSKIGTLDVEVDLIAERIAAHNRLHRKPVEFGVINILTDKPSAHVMTGTATSHDLTKIEVSRKAQARESAVRWAHQRLLQLEAGAL